MFLNHTNPAHCGGIFFGGWLKISQGQQIARGLWHGLLTVPHCRITIHRLTSLRTWAGRETGPQQCQLDLAR